jgi:hypothetical protein
MLPMYRHSILVSDLEATSSVSFRLTVERGLESSYAAGASTAN